MFFCFFTYLKFFLKATNHHGIHSPFVYSYLTKCLYLKPKKSKDKTLDVLLKSIVYFNFTRIKIIGNNDYEKALKNYLPNLNFDDSKVDLLYYETPNFVEPITMTSHYELHNDSLIIFNNINKNSKPYSYWSNFTKWKKATVSIDCYYCGVIFIRREQEKEHFFIRI